MKTVLTTADIAERKRFQFWQDAVCDTFVELDCQAGRHERFFGEITTAACDGLHFSTVVSESQTVRRTRGRISRAREEVMLISLQVRGVGIVAQDGREARLEPGDFACYDSTRPYTLNFDASFEQLVLHMPRDAMVRRIGRTELWTARRIEGASPVGSLVMPFVRRTASIVSDIAPATASRLSETCLSLVTAALGERLSAIGQRHEPRPYGADLPRQGDHRKPSARPRAQHRKGGRADRHFAALRAGSVPRRRHHGQRLYLETPAGKKPPRSRRPAALGATRSRRSRSPAASPISAISAAATRTRSAYRRARIGRCCGVGVCGAAARRSVRNSHALLRGAKRRRNPDPRASRLDCFATRQ